MEIERKYLIDGPEYLPENYCDFPSHTIEQGYLCTSPVVRVRKADDTYYLTYKGKGLLAREEYNLPLTKEAYDHLIQKADGIILRKKRFNIPLAQGFAHPAQTPAQNPGQPENGQAQLNEYNENLVIELDIFEGEYQGLILAEVEFPSLEEAERFVPPKWFGRDVTLSGEYQNSRLSAGNTRK